MMARGVVAACAMAMIMCGTCRAAEDGRAAMERAAMELDVELVRMGQGGDPVEREEILRKIASHEGTEEAEAALWALSSLYLDAFDEPRIAEARAVLEELIDRGSRYPTHAKCRLLALCDAGEERAAQLRAELSKEASLPRSMKGMLR